MSEEKEIKVRVLDDLSVDSIKIAMESLFNVSFNPEKEDKDIYYDLEDNFYFNRNHGLRIRNENELAYKVLFYLPEKTPNPWFVLEKEFKLPITKENLMAIFNIANIECYLEMSDIIDIEELKLILIKLNFIESIKIDKIRCSAKNEHCTICVDSVNDLGLFVEIEVKDDHFLETFRSKLPFEFKEIRHGYTNLYAKEVLKIEVPNFKQNFLDNPDWNYLSGQKELIQKLTQ